MNLNYDNNKIIYNSSITIGNILAVVLSFGINHSIPWAILHGFLGWLYVIFYCIVH